MAIVSETITRDQKLTADQIKEIEEAAKRPAVYDDDCPELTEDQYAELARAARRRDEDKRKKLISIRVSPETLEKVRAAGGMHTGFLSRLLDNAINDPDLVRKSL
ncbi:MAG: BrnA antitoxin family protein [Clostridia bacterium]|nr:BrnA antitoxin family protein [Clostridia bacterium]